MNILILRNYTKNDFISNLMGVNITGNHFLPEIWQAVQNHLLAVHKLNVYSDDKCLMFNSQDSALPVQQKMLLGLETFNLTMITNT